MSAFMCSNKHTNSIVTYGHLHRVHVYLHRKDGSTKILDLANEQDCRYASDALYRANVKSIEARYGAGEAAEFGVPRPIWTPTGTGLPAVAICKACDCFDYQACEYEDYRKSDAYHIVNSIRHEAITSLPGYESASWEIN